MDDKRNIGDGVEGILSVQYVFLHSISSHDALRNDLSCVRAGFGDPTLKEMEAGG